METLDLNMLLYITLLIYIMVMAFAYMFKFNYLYILGGLLWFIPITQIDNMFLILVSVIMVISHFILGFMDNEEREF